MFKNKDKKIYYIAVLLAFISCIFQGLAISKSRENSLYIKSMWNTTRMTNDINTLIYKTTSKSSVSLIVSDIKKQLSILHLMLANKPHINPIKLLEKDILALDQGIHHPRTKDNIVFQLNALKDMLLNDLRAGENISSAFYMLAIATLWATIIILLHVIFKPICNQAPPPTLKANEENGTSSSSPKTIVEESVEAKPKTEGHKLELVTTNDKNDLSGFLIDDDDEDDDSYANIPGMEEIINEFIASIPTRKSSIETSLENNDYETLKREVHTLKGLGGSIGFDNLTKISETIDKDFKEEKMSSGIGKLGELFAELDKIEKSRQG